MKLKMAQELGYKTFFWSLAYVDWNADNQPTHDEAFSKLIPRIHPGAIVLHQGLQKNYPKSYLSYKQGEQLL